MDAADAISDLRIPLFGSLDIVVLLRNSGGFFRRDIIWKSQKDLLGDRLEKEVVVLSKN